jgi:hypothetical protein
MALREGRLKRDMIAEAGRLLLRCFRRSGSDVAVARDAVYRHVSGEEVKGLVHVCEDMVRAVQGLDGDMSLREAMANRTECASAARRMHRAWTETLFPEEMLEEVELLNVEKVRAAAKGFLEVVQDADGAHRGCGVW